ncbi:membrane protein [Catenulispora yoronensis]|uniref:Membrane protein n=1 Tax=Catenulispora yoronensis TaxID=450799 RepID=A0ABN2U1G1_9ACTN
MTTEQLAGPGSRTAAAGSAAAGKVPQVTLIFWVTKVLTTGMGETTSDFFNKTYDPKIMVVLAGLILAGTLWVQFKAPRYSAWIYWSAVVMVSVFGTMCADVLHVALGIPYAVSTAFFAVALAAVFVLWFRVEGTLSIHSITTPRRELFYWLTVVTTFALGTAVGDLTATSLKLGYFSSGVLFAVLFAVPAVGSKLGLNSVLAFWFAYVATRPFGASFADWMGVSTQRGGLAWGTGPVSLVLFGIIVLLVAVLAVTKMDVVERS